MSKQANEIFDTKAYYNKWLLELTENEKELLIDMLNEALEIPCDVDKEELLEVCEHEWEQKGRRLKVCVKCAYAKSF